MIKLLYFLCMVVRGGAFVLLRIAHCAQCLHQFCANAARIKSLLYVHGIQLTSRINPSMASKDILIQIYVLVCL